MLRWLGLFQKSVVTPILETSAAETLYDGQFILQTHFIKSNYLVTLNEFESTGVLFLIALNCAKGEQQSRF